MASVKKNSFYVTCTSNPTEFYPNNKTSSFVTRLPDPIVLDNSDRKWEVGVSSFSYSQAINNFGSGSLIFFYFYDGYEIHSIPIEDQHITSLNEIVNALNLSFLKFINDWNQKLIKIEVKPDRSNRRKKRELYSEHEKEASDVSLEKHSRREEENEKKDTVGNLFAERDTGGVDVTGEKGSGEKKFAEGEVHGKSRGKRSLQDPRSRLNDLHPLEETHNHDDLTVPINEEEIELSSNADDEFKHDRRSRVSPSEEILLSSDELMKLINTFKIEPQEMYKIPFSDFIPDENKRIVIDTAMKNRYLSPSTPVRFILDGELISLTIGNDAFDFAFSPVLIKMIGFQEHHLRFSLEKLKKRIELREMLIGKDSSRMNNINLLKKRILAYTYSSEFYDASDVKSRHLVYQKDLNIPISDFYLRAGELADQYGYSDIKQLMMGEYINGVEEYRKLRDEVFCIPDFTLMDYAIYIVMKESPWSESIKGTRYTTLSPTNMAYVYTNIIVPEIVGDKRLRLLDIMRVRSVSDAKLDLIEFSNTHYKSLDTDTITDISILIATEYGSPVPFRYGPATIQLHFRRKY